MLSIQELKKLLDNSGIAHLTLMNDANETFCAGAPDRVSRCGAKLKMHWTIDPKSHAYSFTYAILHRGKQIYSVTETTPINFSPTSRYLELAFDF